MGIRFGGRSMRKGSYSAFLEAINIVLVAIVLRQLSKEAYRTMLAEAQRNRAIIGISLALFARPIRHKHSALSRRSIRWLAYVMRDPSLKKVGCGIEQTRFGIAGQRV